MRVEQSIAQFIAFYASSKSKEAFHVYDFSPHTTKPKERIPSFGDLENF